MKLMTVKSIRPIRWFAHFTFLAVAGCVLAIALLLPAGAHAATLVATNSADITAPTTWPGGVPIAGDTNLWQTKSSGSGAALTWPNPPTNFTFNGQTLEIVNGGSLSHGSASITQYHLNNMTLDAGGFLKHGANSAWNLAFDANGSTNILQLNGGTISLSLVSTMDNLVLSKVNFNGSGTVTVTRTLAASGVIDFSSPTVDTHWFTGIFSVTGGGQTGVTKFNLPTITDANESFELDLADAKSQWTNVNNIAVTALKLWNSTSSQLDTIAAGSYTATSLGTNYASCFSLPNDNTHTVQVGHSLIYDANGGTNAPAVTWYNTAVTLSNGAGMTYASHVFAGWNTAANGAGAAYAGGASLSLSSNTTLYAQWTLLTGTLTAPATFPAALSAVAGTPSSPTSVSVSGSGLTTSILATAPTGLEVSSDDLTYGPTATFPASGGTLYARLSASAALGTYNSVTVVLSSTSALPVNVATIASGNVVDNPYWALAASGNWGTASNWFAGILASGSDVTADFSRMDITNDTTVHLNTSYTIGSLIFGDSNTNSAANWMVDDNGSSGTNTLTLAGSNPTITVTNLGTGKTATINAVILGTNGLTTAGPGTLVLSGANRFTNNTRIASGTLQLNNTLALQYSTLDLQTADTGTLQFSGIRAATLGGLQGSRNIVLVNTTNGAVNLSVGTNNASTSYAGVLSGTGGGLTKVGTGTLTLTGANTYTGPTIVGTGGTLNVTTLATGAGAYSVSNAATLGVTLAHVGSSLTQASLTLGTTSTNATTLNLIQPPDAYGNPTNALVNVTGALKVNGACTLNLANGTLFPGQFPLIQYGSQTAITNIVLGTLPVGVIAHLTNNATSHVLNLVVTGYNNLRYWNGDVSSLWDLNTTANWQSLTNTGLTYADTHQVVFDDSAAGNFAITLNSTVLPMNVTFSNNANAYSISGPGGIAGYAGLTAAGGGVVTISNANSFSGPTTVNAGALVLKNLGAVAGSFLNIADGAVVQPNLAGTYSNVTTTINGSSHANSSFGGSLDFHAGTTTTWPGEINLNDPSATIGCYGGFPKVTLSGPLTGSGSLTIRPEGGSASIHTATFTLSNPSNNYAGSTTMQVGTAELSATLKSGVNQALPVTTILNLDRAGSSGVVYFDLAGYTQTVAGLTSDFASNAVINSTGTGTLTVSNNVNATFNGVIGTNGSAPINLVKQGNATLTLTGTNLYTGRTILGAGTLALNGRIMATSELLLSSNATLQLTLGAPGGPTNIVVNGNVTLAGQISASDYGIVSNTSYPVIYYTGTLTNNGISVAPGGPCVFTINTNTPHIIYLDVTQVLPPTEFTTPSSAVSALTTNLSGILHGTPAGPIWYEVRDQTNRLWDFGTTLAVTPWSITVRHLRVGTNTVTIFAQDGVGSIHSNSIQLTLTLGATPSARPRPNPAEIWWGGSCHDSLYDANTNLIGTYSRLTQLMQTNGWDFVKRNADGLLLHGAVWVNPVMQMTNWIQVGTSISAQLAPFNGKYWLEDGWQPQTNNMNYGHNTATSHASDIADLQSVGLVVSEITEDFNPHFQDFSEWHPDWPTNNIRALVTGYTNGVSTNYPYTSGLWRDYASDFHGLRPGIKFGWTYSPVWFHWQSGASLATDSGIFTIRYNGTNYNFNWDFYNFMNDAITIGNQTGVPFSFASDCPWDYYGQNPDLWHWTPAQQLANRNKIRNYEAWLRGQNLRHTQICNYSQTTPGNTNLNDVTYETNSLSTMWMHQQEGGRAGRYLFESWYQGPFSVVPETKAGSYTHLALTAIKYLKGIADTNGNLEPLNLTPIATNGTVVQLQLQNNGDVQCLPALAAQAGSVPGVTTRYFTTNGLELTATALTAEGLCFTNMLQPAAKTNLFAITLASGLTSPTNDNALLEAFWNPQDPLGIVRDRELFATSLTPLGGWLDADLGSVGVAGGSALSSTTFTLLGSGADIGSTADAFHFVYQTNNGSGTFTARVTSQMAADASSKAGVMIRESTAPGARHVFLGLTPANGLSLLSRVTTNGATASIVVGGIATPYWVQLVRSGATFTANYSSNGVNWVTAGSTNVAGFAPTALWGMAVTAHSNTMACAATFDELSLPIANQASAIFFR